MNNWIKRLCTAAFFPAALTCILLALWLFPPAVPVDNITPAEDIISREYSLERLLLTKAIFDVRHGFEEVTAQQLARETGVLLECRRQITERQYYYVVEGCGYQCFLFADEDDILYRCYMVLIYYSAALCILVPVFLATVSSETVNFIVLCVLNSINILINILIRIQFDASWVSKYAKKRK